ncbi:polysaccharide pyruvyl transferase family protein [Limosilactobacillus ingluviei]|uniref:polysaccharide pyruvyl transferase family protein n=1 Tax=Limosilactobacillus ingluviei TaxID=148604 RepID=UPI00030F0F80|nr:polysaccharide pyruvyl transferase family protein [Limosilactobacillus ingluviei]
MKDLFKIIKNEIKRWLIVAKYAGKTQDSEKFLAHKNKKRIFYMMVPTHGNLGDQAIAEATYKLFKREFADYDVITTYDEDVYKDIYLIKKCITKDDIVVLHGGGNMGDLYKTAEQQRQCIVRNLFEYKIIILTQTTNYSDSKYGEFLLKRTQKLFNKCKDLTLCARENRTFEFMKVNFPKSRVVFIPDIVFSLATKRNEQNREFIMTCLRSDEESVQTSVGSILNSVAELDSKTFIYDTYVARRIDSSNRQVEVNSIINQFYRAKLVVTDRMHGMVLAAITGTPCIVTKSLDYKIIGTYQWIKDLNYIKLVKKLDGETLRQSIQELESLSDKDEIRVKEKYLLDLRTKLGVS